MSDVQGIVKLHGKKSQVLFVVEYRDSGNPRLAERLRRRQSESGHYDQPHDRDR